MPQSTRRWIEEKVKSFRESEVLPFHEILSADMVKSAVAASGIKFKDRIYTPFVTLCLFLSRCLTPITHVAGGRAVDRLDGDEWAQAVRGEHHQLLRCTTTASTGGHRLPGPSDRARDRGWRQRQLALERTQSLDGRRQHFVDARHPAEPESFPAVEFPGHRPGVSAGPVCGDHRTGHWGRSRPGNRTV